METLTAALSRRTKLQVAAPSEVRDIRSAEQARRELGVNLVLTGSLQPRPTGLRLTLRLVDPASRRQLDAREIDFGPDRLLEMEEAIRLDTKMAEAWAGLAVVIQVQYRQKQASARLEEAVHAVRRAQELKPNLGEAHVLLVSVLADAGRLDETKKELESARNSISPESPLFWKLAGSYQALGQKEQAEEIYRKALAARPYDWKVYNSLGIFYARNCRYREAAKQF